MSGLAAGEGSRFMNAKNADATIGGIRVLQKLMKVNATVARPFSVPKRLNSYESYSNLIYSNFLRDLGRSACFWLDWQRLRGPKDRFWQAIYWGYLGL